MSENKPTETKITFGKIFWPSFLAVFIAGIVGMIFFFLILGGVIGSFSDFGPKPLSIEDKTILHMQLDGEILNKGKSEFDPSTLNVNESMGLPDILYGIS